MPVRAVASVRSKSGTDRIDRLRRMTRELDRSAEGDPPTSVPRVNSDPIRTIGYTVPLKPAPERFRDRWPVHGVILDLTIGDNCASQNPRR